MQRGLEHYERQVSLANIPRDLAFEDRVASCRVQIATRTTAINQSQTVPRSQKGFKIESWMLSSDDVSFNPEDLSTFLGRGGFATVFRGKYQGQDVAVKRFDQIILADSMEWEKLIAKEIKAWQDISHEPFVLTLIGVCTKIPVPILVSELCQTNIRRFVRDCPDAVLPMVYQFACGISSLHRANIIHRDLKGDNVLVTFRNTVAIADFGLSRTAVSLQNTHKIASGTLNWMSPEQYLTARNVTTKFDIWSFGMTKWEIICDKSPYHDCCANEISEAIQTTHDRPNKPDDLSSHLEPLWTLITKCWQKEPTARPSIEDVIAYLESNYSSNELKL
ncbi:hypothetical protein LEN26_009429 [Aphanomyces euteiches]|nr:hypothetical protein AeMF1_010748 [Aphanomyces euteiches]KAH9126103.1 hypothetical protein LEN26_009429 [Aphanomyces euteiches]KAH9187052.1 hypothetical protein AeNC1_010974 [Aphanomyces euteiches]